MFVSLDAHIVLASGRARQGWSCRAATQRI